VDQEQRERRREQARHRTRRNRRTAIAAVLALGAVAALALLVLPGGGEDGTEASGSEEEAEPAKLPGGVRSIFPERRVVAYYGAPQDRELGALGLGPPARGARRAATSSPSAPCCPRSS
jgi:hypothetical protein